ncbi:hypothetical protein MES4922_40204 [Mesorhizobium ventifaucium]|uniref:Uncharacterized protein n=1 Tax=Mesorhizobium ventifaucium TaxID=666020 RepID=A0ABN8K537_9HYPH|nr:hypothetical protein MES4922_40204 [Mesorhizobium ventifaucium]
MRPALWSYRSDWHSHFYLAGSVDANSSAERPKWWNVAIRPVDRNEQVAPGTAIPDMSVE